MNTPEGRKKAVETNKQRDPDYYKKLGSKGGKNSTYRPMKDPEVASKMAQKRWDEKKKEETEDDGSKTDV